MSKPDCFDVETSVFLRATFYDVDDNLADPSALTLDVKDPNGVVTSFAIGDVTKAAVGIYQQLVALNVAGFWYWKWTGTMGDGTVPVETGSIQVRRDQFN